MCFLIYFFDSRGISICISLQKGCEIFIGDFGLRNNIEYSISVDVKDFGIRKFRFEFYFSLGLDWDFSYKFKLFKVQFFYMKKKNINIFYFILVFLVVCEKIGYVFKLVFSIKMIFYNCSYYCY